MPPRDPDTEDIFGPLVPGRDCGGCTACCEHLTVADAEFQKPAGQLCVHAHRGGCAIHSTRPSVCRGWHCIWRHAADLPDSARPDRAGVIFGYAWDDGPTDPELAQGYVHAVVFGGAGAPVTEAVTEALPVLQGADLPVFASVVAGPKVRVG